MDDKLVLLLGQTGDAKAFRLLFWFFAVLFMLWGLACVLLPGPPAAIRVLGLVWILAAVLLGAFARRWTRCGVYLGRGCTPGMSLTRT